MLEAAQVLHTWEMDHFLTAYWHKPHAQIFTVYQIDYGFWPAPKVIKPNFTEPLRIVAYKGGTNDTLPLHWPGWQNGSKLN